ncbi:MAG: MFS transporter [Planctomycetaceae bacterium]|nr:MFS transporter [Planctomycetaceae bacterium]
MNKPLSETLASRTFIGLLLAQFTATFNDQAIHMVAVFYAVDVLVRYVQVRYVDEKAVVAIVTACFIAPFLLFSSYAGTLGDRFSKRSVIVFWKVAEIGMMGLALFGLLLPHLVPVDSPLLPTLATWSAALVIATVFLMGMHSTFFVPAKLGAMPEILHQSVLSRGNGILEGTSFTAQILGTSAGGILYSMLKGTVSDGSFHPDREWQIGALLLGLALLGTATALLMHRIPAAAPDARLSWSWWQPLRKNLRILWGSKPLMLSVTGIAFCVFMTLFLRQTLLFQGEMNKELQTARVALARSEGQVYEPDQGPVDHVLAAILPAKLERASQESELRVAMLFAVVGLGVGLGSVAAGYLSGHRVELGLVPVGGLAIALFTFLPAVSGESPLLLVASLFGIGAGAGFYLVPLYTLLQHRAPKKSKGNVVAASNFVNTLGGVVSVLLFYLMAYVLDKMFGATIGEHSLRGHPELLPKFVEELELQMRIPRVLLSTMSLLTIVGLAILVRKMPDFFLRTAIWLRAWGHNPLWAVGLDNMPLDGPVILATNCDTFSAALDLIAAVDRFPRVILIERPPADSRAPLVRALANRTGLISLNGQAPAAEWLRVRETGTTTLRRGGMVVLTVGRSGEASPVWSMISEWRSATAATVVPVFCGSAADSTILSDNNPPRVVFGPALDPGADLVTLQTAIAKLAAEPFDST